MIWEKLDADAQLFAYATGCTRQRFDRLVREVEAELAAQPLRGRPCTWPLWQPILISLVYLRSAQPMQWIELTFGVDDSSVSRTVRRMLKLFERVGFVSPAPLPGWSPAQIVDTTLIPSGRPHGWEAQKPLYSAKHKRHGYKVQILEGVEGRWSAVTKPRVAATADATIWALNPKPVQPCYGDRAYPKAEVIRPAKRHEPGQDRERDRVISRLRVKVEHRIKHLKDFKLLRGWRLKRPVGTIWGALCLISALWNG
ncbi:hypothetical protein HYR54_01720 [Candidatus Acetothermia bacterium]|nr:hypothetical protein [Candidatus Acetothermia bacterium]